MEQTNSLFTGRPSKLLILADVIEMFLLLALVFLSSFIINSTLKIDLNSPIQITYIVSGLIIFYTLIRVIKSTYTVFSVKYTLTSQYIEIQHGILSIKKDSIELYRIKDISTYQPFIYRFYSLGNVIIFSTDLTHPTVIIKAIKDFDILKSKIRENVEATRGNAVLETI